MLHPAVISLERVLEESEADTASHCHSSQTHEEVNRGGRRRTSDTAPLREAILRALLTDGCFILDASSTRTATPSSSFKEEDEEIEGNMQPTMDSAPMRGGIPALRSAIQAMQTASRAFFDNTPNTIKALTIHTPDDGDSNGQSATQKSSGSQSAARFTSAHTNNTESDAAGCLELGYNFLPAAKEQKLHQHQQHKADDPHMEIGVESYTVRLPLMCGQVSFPWPLMPPTFEETVTSAFLKMENIGKVITTLILGRENVDVLLGEKTKSKAEGANPQKPQQQEVRDVRGAYEMYSPSVMFLRRYRGVVPAAGAHTDSGLITIMPTTCAAGFQVWSERTGKWQGIATVENRSSQKERSTQSGLETQEEEEELQFLVFGGEMLVAAAAAVQHHDPSAFDAAPSSREPSTDTAREDSEGKAAPPLHRLAAVHRVQVNVATTHNPPAPEKEGTTDSEEHLQLSSSTAATTRLTTPLQYRFPSAWTQRVQDLSNHPSNSDTASRTSSSSSSDTVDVGGRMSGFKAKFLQVQLEE